MIRIPKTPLVGREDVLELLDGVVAGASQAGTAVLLRGEAGIGKSAVLAETVRRADAAGTQVLRTTGVQSEASLAFSGLHQLVGPLLDRLSLLAPGRQTAVRSAFGLVETEEAPDPRMIAFGALELLSAVADETPVLLVADDLQWLDRATIDVVLFLAGHVVHERVAVIVAVRDGPLDALIAGTDLPEIRLSGLDGRAADALLSLHGRAMTPLTRSWLLEQAEGNPLALLELPESAGESTAPPSSLPPGVVPLTDRLERTFAEQARALPGATRRLLLVAAAADREDVDEVLAAATVAGIAEPGRQLSPAIDTRLVVLAGGQLTFRHPLVRSAIYQQASHDERRAVHAALAEALVYEPDRSVWHRAAALARPDDQVAAELEAAAARARRRGAFGDAASALQRASSVSANRTVRGRLLMDAAQLAFETADSDRVLWMLDESQPDESGATGSEHVIEAAESRWQGDAALAMSMLRLTNIRVWYLGLDARVRRRLVEAVDRLDVDRDDPQRVVIEAICSPETLGPNPGARLAGLIAESDGAPETSRLLGISAYTAGYFTLAHDTLTVAIPAVRAEQRPGLAANVLVYRAIVGMHTGAWDLADQDAEEGLWLARQTSQPVWVADAQAAQSALAGVRGDFEAAETLANEADAMVRASRARLVLASVQYARGLTALSAGDPAEAERELSRVLDERDPASHYRLREWVLGDLVEAVVAAGHPERASDLLIAGDQETDAVGSERSGIALAHARAVLADGEDDGLSDVDPALARWPFARARLELLHGERLHRAGRQVDARRRLDAARDGFESLGAVPWARRASRLLDALAEG